MTVLTFLGDFEPRDHSLPVYVSRVELRPFGTEISIRNASPSKNNLKLSKEFFKTEWIEEELSEDLTEVILLISGFKIPGEYDLHRILPMFDDPGNGNILLGVGPFGAIFFSPDLDSNFLVLGDDSEGRESFFNLMLGQCLAWKNSKHLILDQKDKYFPLSKIPGVSVVQTIKEFHNHPLFSSSDCMKWIDDFDRVYDELKKYCTTGLIACGANYVESNWPAAVLRKEHLAEIVIDSSLKEVKLPKVSSEECLWLYCQLVEKEPLNIKAFDDFYAALSGDSNEAAPQVDSQRIPRFDYSWCERNLSAQEGINACLENIISRKETIKSS